MSELKCPTARCEPGGQVGIRARTDPGSQAAADDLAEVRAAARVRKASARPAPGDTLEFRPTQQCATSATGLLTQSLHVTEQQPEDGCVLPQRCRISRTLDLPHEAHVQPSASPRFDGVTDDLEAHIATRGRRRGGVAALGALASAAADAGDDEQLGLDEARIDEASARFWDIGGVKSARSIQAEPTRRAPAAHDPRIAAPARMNRGESTHLGRGPPRVGGNRAMCAPCSHHTTAKAVSTTSPCDAAGPRSRWAASPGCRGVSAVDTGPYRGRVARSGRPTPPRPRLPVSAPAVSAPTFAFP
jgi:hypothetical protein